MFQKDSSNVEEEINDRAERRRRRPENGSYIYY
jgi:hypothetical protein